MRTLMVGPMRGRGIDDPASVFAAVVASVAPAPEYEPPPLWNTAGTLQSLASLTWPLPRKGGT
jgi:hypothetical protein